MIYNDRVIDVDDVAAVDDDGDVDDVDACVVDVVRRRLLRRFPPITRFCSALNLLRFCGMRSPSISRFC